MSGRVVGLGAGGHARVLVEILQLRGRLPDGLLDADPARAGSLVLGVPVLGTDALLERLAAEGFTGFFVGVGTTGAGPGTLRRRLWERGLEAGLAPVDAIHPAAVVSPSALLGPGAAVMALAVLNAGARLGADVIVNTAAVVEHDCEVGDHAHVATGARLAGGVRVGAGAHVGAGATLRQGVSVGEGAVVGAGAVVLRDVPPGEVWAGVPAEPLPRRPK